MLKKMCVVIFTTLCISHFALSEHAPNTLLPEEVAQGWILLWDGESPFGWNPQARAEYLSAEGSLKGAAGSFIWLRHTTPFSNFILQVDFKMLTEEADSGIFIRAAAEGDPSRTGYQININNKNEEYGTGSLVFRVKYNGSKVGIQQWHHYEITAEGDHVTAVLDGKKTLDVRDNTSLMGYVGLQFVKADDMEFRNIKLRPLGLQPLFNGQDLSGWEKVERPNTKEPPEWSVKDGTIHVQKGPGQLETTSTFDNFVLQLDVRANAQNANHHPNSGVFFRGEKGKFWSGYESQIRNEFKEGLRNQPVDFGTGGLYRFQPARRVVSSDNEFFTKTIVAVDRHIAIWINGVQTVNYDDTRPEGAEVGRQARLAAGPISLQAHDPTTNLDFRDIRIASLLKK